MDVFARRGHWLADPEEGIDAWNERMVELGRGPQRSAGDAGSLRQRPGRALLDAVAALSVDDLRSPDGWSWAYDCLYGHVRKHLAMLGPWCVAQAWPAASA